MITAWRLTIAIGALLSCGLVACGSESPPAEPAAEEAPDPASPAVPGAPGAAPEGTATEPAAPTGSVPATDIADPAPPADACARARTCCPAYVAALPNPGERGTAEQACASLELAIASGGPPAAAACQGALEGFRRSLEASGREIPPDCR